MHSYNDIGIGQTLDWPRIRRLLLIGLFASLLVLAGDILLGYGVQDPSLTGIEQLLSSTLALSDARILLSALLGLIGIPLEGLCYFGVYRLMAQASPRHAHAYRSGILGYLAFGGCGVHVPCVACAFFYKSMMAADPETALAATLRFGAFFLVPGAVLFFLFLVVHSAAQISAFARGLTPYPAWCWVFSLPVGMLATALLNLLGNHALVNALTMGWISIGNMWMFGGLLATMNKARSARPPV